MASIDKPFFFTSPYRAAFLASMAGRLKDVISDEGSKLLSERQLRTPATDVSFMLYLSQHDGVSIADIAYAQGFSHQRVASRINQLEKLQLVIRQADPQDQRRKAVYLTELGRQESHTLAEVYQNSALALEQLFAEMGEDLMTTLQQAISLLSQEPLSKRIARLPSHSSTEKESS